MNDLVEVRVKGAIPTPSGCAVFLGNDEKSFVIYVDEQVGSAITRIIQKKTYPRPLTHELIQHIFLGFGLSVQRVVISDLQESTFYARLILSQENELGQKLVELDARPSDSIALALQDHAEILVARSVFDVVEDMSWLLEEHDSDEEDEPE
jgi:bifunctional DNase/RNase